jgi:hypothetical protein
MLEQNIAPGLKVGVKLPGPTITHALGHTKSEPRSRPPAIGINSQKAPIGAVSPPLGRSGDLNQASTITKTYNLID